MTERYDEPEWPYDEDDEPPRRTWSEHALVVAIILNLAGLALSMHALRETRDALALTQKALLETQRAQMITAMAIRHDRER